MKKLSSNNRKIMYIRAGGVLLTLTLLVYIINSQGWGEIWAAMLQVKLIYLILAFIAMTFSRLTIAGRWYALLAVTEVDISLYEAVRLTFAGLFASNFLPTTVGGDVIRFGGATRQKHDAAIVGASLIVDRIIGMSGMFIVFLGGSAYYLKDWILLDPPPGLSSMGIFVTNKWLVKTWHKIQAGSSRVLQSFRYWTTHPRAVIVSFLLTGLHMLCLYSAIDFLLLGLGDDLSLWFVGTLWSLIYFVTLLPISINGYGLQEVSLTFALTNIGGISFRHSLAIALLIRTLLIITSLPGAVFLPGIVASKQRDLRISG
ncbi:MAG: flippase-like domain-containing protein [Chloroflexi bacterium]|nr:flippase-like domain-containing protein [Chloroflexota bacterium]